MNKPTKVMLDLILNDLEELSGNLLTISEDNSDEGTHTV